MSTHAVRVGPLPSWLDARRLLGGDGWLEAGGWWSSTRTGAEAADLASRLRGLGFGGAEVTVDVRPRLPRPLVREARTIDARRRRDTSPGLRRPGVRVDDEGRWSLTPEDLALAMGRLADGARVLDAGCGVGGNSIGFALAGCAVSAVDLDVARLTMARHNAAVYGLTGRIHFAVGDAVAAIRTTEAEIVFVDPPWGIAWDHRRTTLDDLPLLRAAVEACQASERRLWAKVPPSFDPSTAPPGRYSAWFGTAEGDRQRVKFVLARWDGLQPQR